MSLPNEHPVEVAVPEARSASAIADLQRQIDALSRRAAGVCFYAPGGWSDAASPVNNAWTTVPIRLTGTPGTIVPAGAFTENSDGSITVRDAGYYAYSCAFSFDTTTSFANLALGNNSNADNYYAKSSIAQTYSGVLTCSGAGYLTAGFQMYATVFSFNPATTGRIRVFAMHRIGP